ncbi:POK18 protein, partial [Geococcyx californianus]|nr:POK18 protein [Geococcyx californianus]
VQKLAGTINWLRPYLGLTSSQLQPLFQLLAGDANLKAPRQTTAEVQQLIADVERRLHSKFVYRIDLDQEIQLITLFDKQIPYAIIGQWNSEWSDPLHIL